MFVFKHKCSFFAVIQILRYIVLKGKMQYTKLNVQKKKKKTPNSFDCYPHSK